MNAGRGRTQSGILLVTSFLCDSLYTILLGLYNRKYYGETFISWFSTICIAVGTILLSIFCFAPLRKKSSQLVYRLGLATFALVYLSYLIGPSLEFVPLADFLFLAIILLMAIKKTYNQRLRTAGTVLFAAYALIQAVVTIYLNCIYQIDYMVGEVIYWLYLIAEFFAFWTLWRTVSTENCDNTYPPKKLLASLKKQYDNGEISEEEYSLRKNEILSKL